MTTKPKSLSLKRPEIFFLSFAGVGFVRWAPGTMGTLACLPFLYAFTLIGFPPLFLTVPVVILTCVSCYITENLQQELNLHDPSWIVFDEVLGMATAWVLVGPDDLWGLFLLFGLFRFFDIYKIWPASWLDRLTHGCGTILDDVVSGVFAAATYWLMEFTYNWLI